jgi:MSHA biogenesis protein MshL
VNRKLFASTLVAGIIAATVVGCASAPAVEPKTSVRLEPLHTAVTETTPIAPSAPLPQLPELSSGSTISEGSAPRLQTLEATDQEIGVVVRMLATRFGLQYYIDPNVRGTVSARLRNTTLTEALNAIMPPGVTYEIRNGVLRVAPAQMATKIFTLDYVALSRIGTASTVIQRRLGNNAIGGNGGNNGASQSGGQLSGGGLGSGGGADIISAVSVANAWDEIRVSVEALVFDSTASSGADAGGGLAGGVGGSGARPYSRAARDGRRVIINPMSGTITVAAMPRQLDQVEFFIKTFEASIQRQVLIEAKIVEVNLDEQFQFGVDWNVVGRGGTTGLAVRSNPSSTATRGNVEFTLNGGAGQISVILNALSSQGNVRVLSSPRVSALNNQRAVFDVTTGEIVFNVTQTPVFGPNGTQSSTQTVTPQQINVGIVLDVIPQIGADNTVTMNIRPVVTSVRSTAEFRTNDGGVITAPVIDTRETDTMARLRAGETIIIGGLMQTRSEKVKSGVPGLRSIPLLGRLFTSVKNVERKAELVIFLTPTIIAGQPPAAR